MNASSLSGCRATSVFRSAAVRSGDARIAWIASELRGAGADADADADAGAGADAGAEAGAPLADGPPQAETRNDAKRRGAAIRMRALSNTPRAVAKPLHVAREAGARGNEGAAFTESP